jgi:hypothetical protein
MAVQPFVRPWPRFQFLDLFTQSVGLLGRGISPSQGRYLTTGQYNNTHTDIHAGFETAIPVFERVKTVHALDRAAIVIGWFYSIRPGKYRNRTTIRPRPLLSKPFPFYYAPIILQLDAIYSLDIGSIVN